MGQTWHHNMKLNVAINDVSLNHIYVDSHSYLLSTPHL